MKMKTGEERLGKHLVPILAEYGENLGEEAETEKKRINALIDGLSNSV